VCAFSCFHYGNGLETTICRKKSKGNSGIVFSYIKGYIKTTTHEHSLTILPYWPPILIQFSNIQVCAFSCFQDGSGLATTICCKKSKENSGIVFSDIRGYIKNNYSWA